MVFSERRFRGGALQPHPGPDAGLGPHRQGLNSGSSIKTKYELRDGKSVLVRLPDIDFIDDGPGKPVGIQQHIGQRPVMTFGNSDGDLQMLPTTASAGPRFGLIVHHTDTEREWAYDRRWKTVFPKERGRDKFPMMKFGG